MDPGSRSESTGADSAPTMSGLPPGPRNKVLQTLLYMRDPFQYHTSCIRRLGELYTIPAINGPVVMTTNPEGARVAFTLDADHYEPFGVEALRPILGSGSVLLLTGEPHKRERKLLAPQFHGARMRAYGELMQKSALDEAAGWRVGQVVNLQPAMQSLSLQVILRAVFGVVEPKRSVLFEEAVRRFLTSANPLVLFFPALQRELFGIGPWANFLRAQAHINGLIYQQIAEARQRTVPGEDILSLLVAARYEDGGAMADSEVRDELLTLLVAGHETTAQALSWALYYLHRDPATLARLRAELDALGDQAEPETIAAQPYLEAVCNESLRLNPVVAEVSRRLRKPLRFGGYTLPPGVAFGPTIFGIHRRPDLYPEPECFHPERFLARKFSPFEFIPFGGGARRCVGAAFALYEMKLVLFTLLQRYTMALTTARPITPELRGLTLGPKGGVPMRIVGLRFPAKTTAAT